ncbi:MAG: DUF1127 domain-containing protein [Beijerinckiaceae bacterium]
MAPVLSALIRFVTSPDSVIAGAKGVAARVAAIRQARANRRAFRELAGWDDHMLSDIGLTRTAVAGALETGFASDPSRVITSDRKIAEVMKGDAPVASARHAMPAGCWAY